jgi:hypothetical protein
VPAEELAPLEATATVHELRTVPSAEITKIDIPVRESITSGNDDLKLLGSSASQDEATANELQLKKALITFDATAAPHNATPNESRSKGKLTAPGHRRGVSSTSDFTYPPSAATRNVVAQYVEGPTSVYDDSKSSPERDLRNPTRTVTNESFDSTGLTAVNANHSFYSAGLTSVDSTMRDCPGAGDGDVAPLNNAEAVAALTTNWGSRSATVNIFDGSKLWERLKLSWKLPKIRQSLGIRLLNREQDVHQRATLGHSQKMPQERHGSLGSERKHVHWSCFVKERDALRRRHGCNG